MHCGSGVGLRVGGSVGCDVGEAVGGVVGDLVGDSVGGGVGAEVYGGVTRVKLVGSEHVLPMGAWKADTDALKTVFNPPQASNLIS